MMEIGIKALTPDLADAYFDFFDHRAFSDGSPYYPCYCCAFNLSAAGIGSMRKLSKQYGGDTEGWKRAQRETALRMVREGKIRGYLAFDNGTAIGWCNANDRVNYYRVGAFDLDHVPEDQEPADPPRKNQVKSIVCFEISPEYRGKGIASRLLERVCADAEKEGYEFAEAYPCENAGDSPAFTGPKHLYEKAGFTEFALAGSTVIMRKPLE